MLFQELGVSGGEGGHCVLTAEGVSVLRVEGGRYEGVELITDGGAECYGWEERVACADMLHTGEGDKEAEGMAGVVITSLAMLFIFLAVVGAVMGMRGVKSGLD